MVGFARIPAVAADSGTLVVATIDSLFRLSARDGKVVRRVRSPGAIVSPWLAHRGLLVAGTTDSRVVAIAHGDLRPRWRVGAGRSGARVARGARATRSTRRAGGARVYRIVPVAPDTAPVATPIAELDWPVTAPVTVLDGLVLAGRRRRDAPGAPTGRQRGLAASSSRGRSSSARCRWTTGCSPIGGDGDLHRYRR